MLRERRQVRLVLDEHGKPEPLLELGGDGDAVPAEVRGERNRPRRLLDEPGDGDRDSDRAQSCPAAASSALRAARPSRSRTGPGAEPRLSRYDRRSYRTVPVKSSTETAT